MSNPEEIAEWARMDDVSHGSRGYAGSHCKQVQPSLNSWWRLNVPCMRLCT